MYEHLAIKNDAGILTLTLNRPEKRNAFAGRMRRDLAEVLEHATSDEAVRVIVITGAGSAFCAGGDVANMRELAAKDDIEEFRRVLGAARRVVETIRQMPKPVIASINGAATGAGFNLALACDIRFASSEAKFAQSYIKLGLHPDWGGTYFLSRALPSNLACELFFTGDMIDAETAHRWGLLNRIFPPEELEKETRAFAERLSKAAPVTLAATKQAVYTGARETLDFMLQSETEGMLRAFQSADGREGINAFMEKREPKFTGR